MTKCAFSINAETFLRSSVQSVVTTFLSEPQDGSWHPNGFAVFHFGEVPSLGRLRLHVWPRRLRVALKGQPAIHSHPWELCSLVIAGSYRDALYKAREFDKGGSCRLQGFNLQSGIAGEGDLAAPVPMWYEVTVVKERTVVEGSFHYLPAGVLHTAEIPDDQFAATLLITGETIDPKKLLLIGSPEFPATRYARPRVSVEELGHIRSNLLVALRNQQ